MTACAKYRIVIGISGASGSWYAIRLLEQLSQHREIESHLIVSHSAQRTFAFEAPDYPLSRILSLASQVHDVDDIAACISSGSYQTQGMVIIPCSMKTLSGIAHSYSDNLLIRAADVTLKERRPLLLCVRETPLHQGHLRLMLAASELGAIIMPPTPAFYHNPKTIDDIINQTVGRILEQFNIKHTLYQAWQ